MTQYKNLTQQQINVITKHYKHQDSLEEINYFFSKVENELGIKANLVSYAVNIIDADIYDMETDILIFGQGDNKNFFSDFDADKEFPLSLENALEIIDNVLAWQKKLKTK